MHRHIPSIVRQKAKPASTASYTRLCRISVATDLTSINRVANLNRWLKVAED